MATIDEPYNICSYLFIQNIKVLQRRCLKELTFSGKCDDYLFLRHSMHFFVA